MFQIFWLSYRNQCHPNCLIQSMCQERSLSPPSADCMTNPKGNASRDGPGPGGNSIILRGWGGGKPRVSNIKPAFEPFFPRMGNSSLLLLYPISFLWYRLTLVLASTHDLIQELIIWSPSAIWNEIRLWTHEWTSALDFAGSSSQWTLDQSS